MPKKLRAGRNVENLHEHVYETGRSAWLQSTCLPIEGASDAAERTIQLAMDNLDVSRAALGNQRAFEAAWEEFFTHEKAKKLGIRHMTSDALKRFMEVFLVPVFDADDNMLKVGSLRGTIMKGRSICSISKAEIQH